jgi:hypothetical protein
VATNLFADSPFAGSEQERMEFRKGPPGGAKLLSPNDVAQAVIEGMKEKRFYIITPGVEKVAETALTKGRDIKKLEAYFKETFKEPKID